METATTMKYGTMVPVSGEVSEVRLTYRNKVDVSQRQTVGSPYDLARLVRNLAEMDANVGYRELLYAVYMDMGHNVLAVMKISEGGLTATNCDIRILFQGALLLSSTVLALVHNHPSGQMMPSEQDRILAKKVVNAASVLDVSLLDFIIIGEGKDQYYSFLGEGLM